MLRKSLLLLSLFLLLSAYSSTCSAQVYLISDSELTRLDQIFNQLESINNGLSTDLTQSKEELLQLKLQLMGLSEETKRVKEELKQAQDSLARANQSFAQYEKEANTEINNLKMQRILLGSLLLIAIVK